MNHEIKKARELFAISISATKEEVRSRYKDLAKKWHPDINKTKEATSKIQEINKAYAVIMKQQFNVIDPWKDYENWWWKQYGSDSLWGNISLEEYRNSKYAGISKNGVAKLTDKRIKKDIVKDFLDKKNIFAVIGVSKNPKKYGNKVYKELKWAGYKVYPVNPKVEKIGDDKCYPFLAKLPKVPEVINVVVPPKIAEKVVKEAINIGIKKIWLQPGSESNAIIKYCKKHKVSILHNMCIMVERRKR